MIFQRVSLVYVLGSELVGWPAAWATRPAPAGMGCPGDRRQEPRVAGTSSARPAGGGSEREAGCNDLWVSGGKI